MKLSEQLRIGTERTKRWKSAAGHILVGEKEIVEIAQLEAENAALKRENEAWRQAGEDAIKQLGTIVGLMSITALLTAEETNEPTDI